MGGRRVSVARYVRRMASFSPGQAVRVARVCDTWRKPFAGKTGIVKALLSVGMVEVEFPVPVKFPGFGEREIESFYPDELAAL